MSYDTGDTEAVLIVTTSGDATADAVEAELNKLSTPVDRVDLGNFPVRLRLAVKNDSARWRGQLWTDDVSVGFDQVRSVYYRRPTQFSLPPGLSDGDSVFAIAEARLGFGGAFASMRTTWVNHPFKVAIAEYKPLQLNAAAEAGMKVPRTLITNDRDELCAFAEEIDGPVVCKAFSSLVLSEGDAVESVYTTIIDPATVDPQQFSATAHLIQEWIPKDFEVRVTMVGQVPFATAIRAGSDAAQVDWRADYQTLSYEQVETPPDVAESLARYLAAFGLNYGAFDFVVEPDGTCRFLECNPNGQWLWLEHEVGLPIAAALAKLLTKGVELC